MAVNAKQLPHGSRGDLNKQRSTFLPQKYYYNERNIIWYFR